MSDVEPEVEDEPQILVHTAPPSHSRAGHRRFGWCSFCPDHEIWEELAAWRARDNSAIDDHKGVPDKAVPPSKEAERG